MCIRRIRQGVVQVSLLLLLSGCVMISEQRLGQMAGQRDNMASVPVASGSQLNQVELQSALLSFSDSYMERVAQSIDALVMASTDPQAEALLKGTKVIYVSSALTIAAEPDVGQGLLDMMVMLGLQRRVWEQGWEGLVSREQASELVRVLIALEVDLTLLAGKVLSVKQVTALQQLIEDWHRQNPEQRYVAYVRFDDFADTGLKRSFHDALSEQGGLLEPVREAVQEIEQIKMLSERGIFLANHFPILMEWHMEHLFSKVMVSEPVRRLLDDGHRFSHSSERMSVAMEQLPEQLSQERADFMLDLAARIAAERQQILDHLAMLVGQERRALLDDISSMNQPMTALLQQMEQTGMVLRDTAQSVERMTAPDSADGETGWIKLDNTLNQISAGAGELNTLVAALERLTTAPADKTLMAALEQKLEDYTLRLALYLAGLIGVFFVLLAGVIYLALRWQSQARVS
ncbi:hypothetical protein [Oceanisphaera sp. KMM 10153]|uniref:hypothetical protein n=1 Tax=Oceanisphaera submarina TaxID=3390193 RepID=UPI00397559B7